MTIIANTPTAPSQRWLRLGLVLIAALEFLDALSGVENIFADYHHDTALLRFAQTLTSIRLALAPVISGAALVFAALGNVRRSILALAALILMVWLLDALPDMAIHGLGLSFDYGGMEFVRARLHLSSRRTGRRGPDAQAPAASACRLVGLPADAVQLGRRGDLYRCRHHARFLIEPAIGNGPHLITVNKSRT